MFKQLYTLTADCNVGMTISADTTAGTLTLNIIPQPKSKDAPAGLRTPLSVTATPEELEAEFPGCLTSFVSKRKALAEQVEATAAILEAAKEEAVQKGVKAATKASTKASASIAATTTATSQQSPGGNSSADRADANAGQSAGKAEDDQTINLFDDD